MILRQQWLSALLLLLLAVFSSTASQAASVEAEQASFRPGEVWKGSRRSGNTDWRVEIIATAAAGDIAVTPAPATSDRTAAEGPLRPGQQVIVDEIRAAYSDDIDTIRLVAAHAEHAALALAAYSHAADADPSTATVLPHGWTVEKRDLVPVTAGNLAWVLLGHEDGRWVLAYRGTVTGGDWLTNLASAVNIPTKQVQEAMALARQLAREHPEIVFVGHSLGGRLANIARMQTGRDAVVFDKAPHAAGELAGEVVGEVVARTPPGKLVAFRSPQDRVSLLSAAGDIEVANFHTYDEVDWLDRTGFDRVTAVLHNHAMGHLAAAMRTVEIALPWIERELGLTTVTSDRLDAATLEDLQVACAAGNAVICMALGRRYETGDAVERDVARAAELYRQACDGDSAVGCRHLGNLHYRGEGVVKDFGRATELYRQACDGDNAVGCRNLGSAYYRGEGVAKDVARAVELFQQACDAGDAGGCANLGHRYFQGDGVAKDVARAVELYHQACHTGDASTCTSLGHLYRQGDRVEKNLVHAATFYQLACEQGSMAGCGSLALLYQTGQGIETDLARAVELFIQACDGKEPFSCDNLGVIYRDGVGVKQDHARAAALFELACDGAHMAGCLNLGNLYHRGEGVAKDLAQASELFQQACDGGNARVYNNLGVSFLGGFDVAEDLARAVELFQQACDGGLAAGCSNLGERFKDGIGVTKDLGRAVELYQQACDADGVSGCSQLGDRYFQGDGVDEDLARSAQLYQQACDGGLQLACDRHREVMALSTTAVGPLAAADPETLEVELDDGTVLVGRVGEATLSFTSTFGTIPITLTELVTYGDERLTLADGSVLNGRFAEAALPLETARGSLELPAARVVAVRRPGLPAATAAPATAAPQRAVLTGQIVDYFDRPIAGATLRIAGSAFEARTDSAGRYELPFARGRMRVQVDYPAHEGIAFELEVVQAISYPVETKVLLPTINDDSGLHIYSPGGFQIIRNGCASIPHPRPRMFNDRINRANPIAVSWLAIVNEYVFFAQKWDNALFSPRISIIEITDKIKESLFHLNPVGENVTELVAYAGKTALYRMPSRPGIYHTRAMSCIAFSIPG